MSEENTSTVDETANFEVTSSDFDVVETSSEPAEVEEAKQEEVSQGSEEKAEPVEETSEPKKQNKFQDRIGELVRDRESEKRRADEAEARIKELEEKNRAPEVKPEPKEEDYDSYDDYLDAIDKHEAEKDFNDRRAEREKNNPKKEPEKADTDNQLTDEQQTAMSIVGEKIKLNKDEYKDFNEVALAEDVDITAEMMVALSDCDDPTKVLYHLGKNKEVASKIARKSARQQMREIWALDSSVKNDKPKPTQITKAPDTINPVSPSSNHAPALNDMSFSDYEKHMNEKEKASGQKWQ